VEACNRQIGAGKIAGQTIEKTGNTAILARHTETKISYALGLATALKLILAYLCLGDSARRQRPIADLHDDFSMLRSGPSLRPLVHG